MGVFPLSAEAAIAFNIRFFDRRVYYLEEDPINIQITITNNSPLPFRFKLADDRSFSVDFDVRTNANRIVDYSNHLIRRRSQSQQVFFREISIAPGESFSFVEDLKDYAALTQTGSYVVQARLFPELFQSIGTVTRAGTFIGNTLIAAGQPLESNRLLLSIRPRPIPGPDGIPLELDVETNAVLARERFPPDEVVSYLLTARMRGHWERFFLYLDLEAMISRDPVRRRQWNAESEEGRRQMIARYRHDLQNSNVDWDLSLVPIYFRIEHTQYNAHEGIVVAVQYYRDMNLVIRKRYTWYLERKDDIWVIVNYSVANLGTE
jgi:hypothetical protein